MPSLWTLRREAQAEVGRRVTSRNRLRAGLARRRSHCVERHGLANGPIPCIVWMQMIPAVVLRQQAPWTIRIANDGVEVDDGIELVRGAHPRVQLLARCFFLGRVEAGHRVGVLERRHGGTNDSQPPFVCERNESALASDELIDRGPLRLRLECPRKGDVVHADAHDDDIYAGLAQHVALETRQRGGPERRSWKPRRHSPRWSVARGAPLRCAAAGRRTGSRAGCGPGPRRYWCGRRAATSGWSTARPCRWVPAEARQPRCRSSDRAPERPRPARQGPALDKRPTELEACAWRCATSTGKNPQAACTVDGPDRRTRRFRRGPPLGLAESVEAVISSPATELLSSASFG